MKVYVVAWTETYEGGEVYGVYSTREMAEASWRVRNESGWSDILEFELDCDPDADKPDIDRRPRYGPLTFAQHQMNVTYDRIILQNLLATPSPLDKIFQLPFRSGNTIQFFTSPLPENNS